MTRECNPSPCAKASNRLQETDALLARGPRDIPRRWIATHNQRREDPLKELLTTQLQSTPQLLRALPHGSQRRSLHDTWSGVRRTYVALRLIAACGATARRVARVWPGPCSR